MNDKKQPIYFESIKTRVRFNISKNEKSFDGFFRYLINKNSDSTYCISFFEEDKKRFKPSKELI